MMTVNTRKSMRNYQIAGLFGLIVIAGGLGAWAVFSSIQGAIIAQGVMTVESHSKKIQHKLGGIIKTIRVKEGQRVQAGELLIQLDETESRAQLAILDALLVEQAAQKARLKALRDEADTVKFPGELLARKSEAAVAEAISGQRKLFNTLRAAQIGRHKQLAERIAQFEKQIIGLEAQVEARKKQFKLINGELADLEKLHKQGLVPTSRILSLKRERANLGGQEGELVSSIAQVRSRIGETKLQIIQLKDDDRSKALSELRQIQTQTKEYSERKIVTSALLNRTKITAPRAGFIHQLTAHTIGGVVAPGETIMLIVPELDDLIVAAQVNPQDIDQVQVGQSARVRFSSFNTRTTPEVSAKVTHVSADLTQPDARTPPYYAIKLKLVKEDMKKLGDNKLIAGMPAETYIQTRARSPLSYLIQPLRDQIMRAFREE